MKFFEMRSTGSGDTLTVETDVTIENGINIGASGGMDSKVIIKDATLTLNERISLLQYLIMEGEAKLNITNGVASFHSAPEINLSDKAEIHISGDGYSCVFYKEGTENTNAFDALVLGNWLPAGYSFKEEGYYYSLYDNSDNLETDAITIKKQQNEEKETLSVDESVQSFAYDNTEKAFEIKGDVTDGFNVKYQQNGQDVTPKNAGSYTVIITRAEDDTYKKFEKTLSDALVIKKADAVISVDTTPITVTYGDKLTLPTATSTFGEVKTDKTVEQLKNQGTYEVTYSVDGTDNYNGDEKIVKVTILPKKIDPEITLSAPVKNATPQTKITGEGYTATVEWLPSVTDTFDYDTEYTAIIKITPDSNHTVRGISENEYKVYGAKTVSNAADSNEVTVTYEKTGSKSSGGGGGSLAPATYTVKFEADGGSETYSVKVSKNKTIDEPTAPTKDGYTFEGWYKDKELKNVYDFSEKVQKSFTLYAKWTKEDDDSDKNSGSGHNCPSRKFSDLDTTQWYHFDTDYVIGKDIFRGITEDLFAPYGNITRGMMITVLYRAEGEPEVTGETTFKDVDDTAYYAKAVIWGQQNGIIKGYSESEFAPELDILREQIAAIIHRYAQYKGYDVSVGENTNILSYDDFAQISEYAIASMQWAVGSGLMKGKTTSTLNPLDNATRAEIAAVLHRFIEANK